ncbi:MAG: YajQ family cyclic di-GMP-binding protein [Actinomycetota bacterium]
MAQSSFDVVSEIDAQEVRNALDQARREIATRFDFKGTGTDITSADETSFEIHANSEGRVQAAAEVLKDKMVKRNVSLKALQEGKIEPGASATYKMKITLVKGISDEKARALNKFIKGLPVRVQSQVQGEQLRVTAKSRDDLQAVIQALKDEDFGIPLQFINYR